MWKTRPRQAQLNEAFAWLFGTSPVEELPMLSEQTIDAACAVAMRTWQVLPLSAGRLLARVPGELRAHRSVRRVRDHGVAMAVLAQLQRRRTLSLADAFVRAGIPHIFLKGTATSFCAFEAPELRLGNDLDIAVPKRWIEAARELVLQLGFQHAEWDDKLQRFVPDRPALRRLVEESHYELGFLVREQVVEGLEAAIQQTIERALEIEGTWWKRGGVLGCSLVVDVHHAVSFEVPAERLIESSAVLPVAEHELRIPAWPWLVWHILFKLYWEGVERYGRGLYQYADLIRVLPRLGEQDVASLIELLVAFKLDAGAHYVLRRLPQHFGVSLPEGLQEFVDYSARAPRFSTADKENDRGDMWPKLWGRR